MNEPQFAQHLADNGYSEANTVIYEPGMSNDMHTHPFSACLLIQEGAMTIVTEQGPVTYQPGDTCEVTAGTLHSEQSGANGVTFLAGRK